MPLGFLGFGLAMDYAMHEMMFFRQNYVLVDNLGVLHVAIQTLLQFYEISESLLNCMH